jgi:hypothetical protein
MTSIRALDGIRQAGFRPSHLGEGNGVGGMLTALLILEVKMEALNIVTLPEP